ncbi:hypothetical protein WOLCODRAFT_156963 [Wolfiporia cocos MD-104 SS10]|uniref:DUF1275 domain protein n=1 Tax=Wolfiporia cocos (strain MD-104) TaxID=742152 RepID=A0A2H3J1W3_WOLCO|nr:hypothetical protein WOLCODRAFT_156963 [Wolfiporia cocos MD-104 SS10]
MPDNDPEPAPPNAALLLLCLCTGLVDSLTYVSSGVWCAFVTGTTIQLGMDIPIALSYLLSAKFQPDAFHRIASSSSSVRFASLIGFLVGGHASSHSLLATNPAISSTMQAALLVLASTVILSRAGTSPLVVGIPHAHITLPIVSASMAIQAVLVQHYHTAYATSVAWTSVWLSIVTPSSARSRLYKIAGLIVLIIGAGIGTVVLGRVDGDEQTESGEDRARRVGWGLLAAAGIKLIAAVMFRVQRHKHIHEGRIHL